ncbi:hypothetical protein [Desulfobotulus sp.]|jgi:hypothetical protein|uniref:hypothetical protein n=1 Tax=Desulfobotulus sp. TaxID=1940337 RepID=UPI002A363EBF|nr:hypothetical protein [Desulfobotulus sp.]MDY0162418.1 hypothetical protein [Desulfobotulus sp.]
MPFPALSGGRIFHGLLILICLAFALFGIHVLRMAYHLEEPGHFILFFFAANFIILFSLTFALIFLLRMRQTKEKNPPADE